MKTKKKITELRSLIYGKFDSQTEFAERLGWSKQRLSKITSGRKEPSIREVSAISQGLGIDIAVVARIFVQYWSLVGKRETA
ncbi:MAG: helix-turn-helix transcriptional regulator [Clostridiales bacterium]|nr:helix-turn-helix transcriptional regulator [Clostridiales bacterium]